MALSDGDKAEIKEMAREIVKEIAAAAPGARGSV